MPLCVHRAEVGVCKFVEWIVLQLLVECFDRVVVLPVVPVGAAEVVVGELVVRVDLDLFLEGRDGLIVLPHLQVDQAEIVPCELVFGIDLGSVLEQRLRHRQVTGFLSGSGALDQLIGLHISGRDKASGGGILERELLIQIGADGAAEGFVVSCASDGKLILT